MDRPILSMAIGLPGSGKSTFWEGTKHLIICPDEIRKGFKVIYDPKIEPKVWDTAYQWLNDALEVGLQVVFDATNITRDRRAKLINIAKKYNAEVYGAWLDTTLEVCLERNARRENPVPEDVIQRMFQNFEEPLIDEGFDGIFRVGGI